MSEKPIVSVIVTHQSRIRCLLSELLNEKFDRFKNAAIVKLILKKKSLGGIRIRVELVYEGKVNNTNNKKIYYTAQTLDDKVKERMKHGETNETNYATWINNNPYKYHLISDLLALSINIDENDPNNKRKQRIADNAIRNLRTDESLYHSGGSSCKKLEQIETYNNIFFCKEKEKKTNINNVIKINGDGKCGWYSIFVYLKLLYLKHPEHFKTNPPDSIQYKIREYFDNHNDIFRKEGEEEEVSISVVGSKSGDEENHFINLMNILLPNRDKNQEIEQLEFLDFFEEEDKKNNHYSSELDTYLNVPILIVIVTSTSTSEKKIQYRRFNKNKNKNNNKIPPIILLNIDEGLEGLEGLEGSKRKREHYNLINNIDYDLPIYTEEEEPANQEIRMKKLIEEFDQSPKEVTYNYDNVNKLISKLNSTTTPPPSSSSSSPLSRIDTPVESAYTPSMETITDSSHSKDKEWETIEEFQEKIDDVFNFVEIPDIKYNISGLNDNEEYHFYLIRHGEALHNKYRKDIEKIFRKYDTSLTKDGKTQAEEAGHKLLEILSSPVNYIFVSDLKRTHQTLERVYKNIYKHNLVPGLANPPVSQIYNTEEEVIVLPCAHELRYTYKGTKKTKKKGYCDKSQKWKFVPNENKTSCKNIDKCDKEINVIGAPSPILNWEYYRTFYNKEGKKTRRTSSKKNCKNTNMIEQAIQIINEREKGRVKGGGIKKNRKTRSRSRSRSRSRKLTKKKIKK